MSSDLDAASESGPALPTAGSPDAAGSGTLAAFTLTTFLSALLLFSVQPMFAKMVLPLLGGSPSVWAVALLFFQGALLLGYLYAHLLIRFVPVAIGGFVHLALMAVAFVVLPIGVPESWREPPPGDPYLWQVGLFAVAIGLPFVAVSANAPLLQAWFARTGHRQSSDPYFLYAASNLGSFIALLSYPFLLEPVFGLSALATIWTVGFLALAGAIAFCFVLVRRSPQVVEDGVRSVAETGLDRAPTLRERAKWVGLALVPSAMLTAFTTHVATDVASAPLIWVIPLALYLLTFVIVFRERSLIRMPILLFVHLVTVILALLQLSQTEHETWFLTAGLGVFAFFSSTLVAHRTLYEARPPASRLTEFYMWMSLGGVLGGVFAALIAPRLFSEVFEYPLLLALTFACRPGALDLRSRDGYEPIRVLAIIAFGFVMIYWLPWASSNLEIHYGRWGVTPVIVLAFAVAVLVFWWHPVRQLAAALLMYVAIVMLPSNVHRGEAQRSYFGVYRVIQSDDGEFNILQHGTTLHGAQRIRNTKGQPVSDTTPQTYYHPRSPMAYSVRIMSTLMAQQTKRPGRFGVIGLGSGSLACHSSAGEKWRFFEIDPVIVGIAKSRYFTFLSRCQPDADIVIGDARLTFAKEPLDSYDLLIVDAFSSDAIPVHLLTAEAIKTYAERLSPTGAGVLHISNRYLDLESVLATTIPLVPGIKAIVIEDDADDGYSVTGSTVVVFSKSDDLLTLFRQTPGSRDFAPSTLRPWTDDASDVLGPLIAQARGHG